MGELNLGVSGEMENLRYSFILLSLFCRLLMTEIMLAHQTRHWLVSEYVNHEKINLVSRDFPRKLRGLNVIRVMCRWIANPERRGSQ